MPKKNVAPVVSADVTVQNEGSIFLFNLNTEAAREWVSEHVSEDATFWAGSLVVEHRYAANLAAGMQADGLRVL